MGEWLEISAKTTDDAVTEALIKLGTTSDKVEYEVLEKESRGFLGFGSRPAKIRARKKEEEKPVIKPEPVNDKEVQTQPLPTVQTKKTEFLMRESKTSQIKATQTKESYEKKEEKYSDSYRRDSKSVRYDKGDNEYKNPYSSSSFKQHTNEQELETKSSIGHETKEPAKIENIEELKKDAREFLNSIFETMNMPAEMEISFHELETTIEIDLKGEDMGILIGKRGQTLDSLQYLVSLVVNRKSNSYVKVKLDTENYRDRRKETLENLAKNIAFKVKRTKHSVTLEPMNPYERRIIHSALQYDKFVETHSEGEEPYRKVVVTLKRNNRDYGNRRGSYRREYHSYKRDYNNYKRTRHAEKETEQQSSEE